MGQPAAVSGKVGGELGNHVPYWDQRAHLWHKEAAESYGKFVNHEDYAKLTESERYERIQQIFSESNISLEEVDINTLNIMQNIPEQESEEREEEGLYNENVELNEDHEEYIDDYDEEQEVEFNV